MSGSSWQQRTIGRPYWRRRHERRGQVTSAAALYFSQWARVQVKAFPCRQVSQVLLFLFFFLSPIWLWLVAERSGTCCNRRLSWWSWSPASLCLSAPGGRASALQPECPLSACRWSPWFSAKQEHTWNPLKCHFIYCISKVVARPRICISFPPFQLTSAPSRQVA